MTRSLIGLGANLGDRTTSLDAALRALAENAQVRVISHSGWRETTPVGGPGGQPTYLNGAALVETTLPPRSLLGRLHAIENERGRTRNERWTARTLDLDLLLYGDQVCQEPDLTVPHPRMAVRRFVLEPASEIAAEMPIPTLGWTVGRAAEHLRTSARYVAITGLPGSGKSSLSQAVCDHLPARFLEDPRASLNSPPDSPSPVFRRQIELAERRAEVLRGECFPPDQWTISDFWFPQTLAYASAVLPPSDYLLLNEQVDRLCPRIAAPRMTIVLEAPVEQLWSITRASNPALRARDEIKFREIANALSDWTYRPHQGPLLRLSADQPERAIAETIAAALASV